MDRSQLIGNVRGNVASLSRGNLGVPLLVLIMLGMMTLPVPPFLLDVFFTFNIALSIVVLLVSVYALRPLDFAVFPTILLVSTLRTPTTSNRAQETGALHRQRSPSDPGAGRDGNRRCPLAEPRRDSAA